MDSSAIQAATWVKTSMCCITSSTAVRQIIEPHMPSASVLGYNEIVQGVEVESLALVGLPPAPAANRAVQEAAA